MLLAKNVRRLMVLILCVVSSACSEATTSIPLLTPTPPLEVSALPTKAWSRCFHDANLDRGSTYLWELPGVLPNDPDSAVGGRRGAIMGEIPRCTELQITQTAWSETDQKYWVYVVWDSQQGWVKIDYVQFQP